MSAPLPDALRSLLHGHTCEIVTTGESSARVERWVSARGSVFFLKYGAAGGPFPIVDEIARLEWMATNGIAVPRVVAAVIEGENGFLLTESLPGADASVATRRSKRATVAALASALRGLHATPVEGCPFVHPAATRVEEAARRVASGCIDPEEFDAGRETRDPVHLLGILNATHERLAGRQRRGEVSPEGRTFTHGDYCLPNIILQRVRSDSSETHVLSGFIDVGRAGVADQYQDLALAARSITRNLGARWAPLFLSEYGLDRVDEERLEFYTLLDEFF